VFFLTTLFFEEDKKIFLQNGRFRSWFTKCCNILPTKLNRILDDKVDICSLELTSKVRGKISWNFREIAAKFQFKMAESRDEDFSGTRILWGSRYTSKFLEF
jgi:hypothetical protein